MLKRHLALALILSLSSPIFAAPISDQAVGNLLDVLQAGGGVYDGGRNSAAPVIPVKAAPAKQAQPLAPAKSDDKPAAQKTATQAAPEDVQPTQAHGISDGYVGLYKEDELVLGTGRCSGCRAPEQGKWYFLNDVIATPKSGTPALIWLGAHELVEGAALSADGNSVKLKDGTVLPFALVDKIPSNRSYYNADTLKYLQGRTLRMRGEYAIVNGVKTFVARSIWPEDYRIDAASLKTLGTKDKGDVDGLVKADKGGAKAPFQTSLLWEAEGGSRDWTGKPVMGVMLNGAQGDDDEALAGHFSLFTGRYGPNGSMADWMFNNFYDMNTTSEKGIIAAMVPMDKYMTDLNSGQSWYRPSYLLVMVMKDGRVPEKLQETFKERYAQYYRQDFKYDHNHLNCTALIADPVRADGWNVPTEPKTPKPIAKAFAFIAGKLAGARAGREIYETMREDPTRSFPRAAFDQVGGDLLSMAGANGADPLKRKLSPLEQMMKDDLEAIIWVRMPQIPSSRKYGREAVKSVTDYMARTKGQVKQVIPTEPRPYPPPH